MEEKVLTNLKKINLLLSLLIFTMAVYLLILPYTPQIIFALESSVREETDLNNLPITETNRLIIPKIFVDAEILEGDDKSILDNGIWRRPNTSNPEIGGNTVIVAHRFLYTSGPMTFFHLDKLHAGDEFAVIWNDKKYLYKISETKEVTPEATIIEANTDRSIVTLYTCTPLWTAEKRLVVIGELISN